MFLALTRWGNDPAECCRQLVAAGQRTKDATLFEAAGLLAFRNEKYDDARQDFEMARVSYAAKPDQLRSGMLVAECWNGLQKKSVATETLRSLEKEFAGLPQVKAVTEQISKLNPPSPPPAAPKPPAPAGKENKK